MFGFVLVATNLQHIKENILVYLPFYDSFILKEMVCYVLLYFHTKSSSAFTEHYILYTVSMSMTDIFMENGIHPQFSFKILTATHSN